MDSKIIIVFVAVLSSAYAGFGYHDLGYGHAPIIEHAPIYKAAPVIAVHQPIVKAIPVIKHIPAATSYASITQVHVSHPVPVVKTVLAPQPILKTYAPIPYPLTHGFHGYHH